jgi:hypothetical protein
MSAARRHAFARAIARLMLDHAGKVLAEVADLRQLYDALIADDRGQILTAYDVCRTRRHDIAGSAVLAAIRYVLWDDPVSKQVAVILSKRSLPKKLRPAVDAIAAMTG